MTEAHGLRLSMRARIAAFTRTVGLSGALLTLLMLLAQGAPSTASAASQGEAGATKRKIEAVKGEIKSLQDDIAADQGRKADAQQALGRLDREIAATSQRIRSLQTQMDTARAQLATLEAQHRQIEADIDEQKKAVSELVVAGHRQGPEGPVKSALNQQDAGGMTRFMTYQRHVHQARREKLDDFAAMLDALAENEAQAQAEMDRLATLKVDLDKQQDALTKRKAERRKALASLDKTLADKGTRLKTLESNKANLEAVLRKIQDAMARMGQFDGGTPLVKQHGHLPWPVPGRILNAFGSTREGELRFEGVTLQANEGTPVRVIHNGRVVFAEWLRGYGMLVIVDHGGGLMSLYGNNQSLATKAGETVEAGAVIAYSGSSGLNKPATYFEIRQRGQPVNPQAWCVRR